MNANELRLDDGFATFITFENLAGIKLFEKDVTPPGLATGGAIDTTTMRNEAWRTQAPRALKSITPVNATVSYATEALPLMFGQIGILQKVTITFPDKSTIEFYGWLDSFTPNANTEGEQPTASIVVEPSMRDPLGEESAPVYTPPPVTPE
jgi:hypothetical protein